MSKPWSPAQCECHSAPDTSNYTISQVLALDHCPSERRTVLALSSLEAFSQFEELEGGQAHSQKDTWCVCSDNSVKY